MKKDDGFMDGLENELEREIIPTAPDSPTESKADKDNRRAVKALRELTDIDNENVKRSVSLREVLGGDILAGPWFRKQFWYMVLLVGLAVFYVSNRYQSQQELIEIDHLQKQLLDVSYNELTRSSELLERTRRSRVEEYLRTSNDSTLQSATTSPYILKVDE